MGAESKPLLTALGWTKEVRAQRQVATANVGTEPPAGLVLLLRLYILSLPFTGFMLLNLSWIGFGVSPGYISSAMLFFFWLLRDRTHSSKPLTIPGKIAIVYVVFVFLSVVQSGAIPAGVGAFYEKKPWLYGFTQSIYVAWTMGIFIILCQIFSNFPGLCFRVLRWHVLTSLFVCAWGIYQWIAYFVGWDYITFFNNNPYRAELYFQTFAGLKRVSSIMNEPSQLGIYLLTVIPILFVDTPALQNIVSNRLRFIALITCITTIFLTTSMSGYASFAIFIGLFVLSRKRWKSRQGILVLGCILVSFAAAAALFARQASDFSLKEAMADRVLSSASDPDGSTLERFSSAVAAFAMFLDHTLVGVGEGNYGFYYDRYSTALNTGIVPRVYAFFPRLLAEHGLVGVSIFLYLLFRIQRPALLPKRRNKSIVLETLTFGYIAACLNLFTSQAEIEHFYIWFLAAVVVGVGLLETEHASQHEIANEYLLLSSSGEPGVAHA